MSKEDARKKAFGYRLGEIMRERGLKVADLILLIDDTRELSGLIAENTVRGWLNGDNVPSFEKLVALAIALDLSVDYLLCLDDRNICGDIVEAVNSVLKQHDRNLRISLMPGTGHTHCMQCMMESNVFDLYSSASAVHGGKASLTHTTEDIYVIVNGNIYPEDYYYKHEGEIQNNAESVCSIVDMAVRQRSIRPMKTLRAAYNKNRVGLGVIGSALNADEFIQLCYTLGYFSKHR